MPANPWHATLELVSNAVIYNLFALIQANDPTVKHASCHALSIQVDPGAGGAKVFIGDAAVSSTDRGAELLAGATKTYEPAGQNLYLLNQLFLKSDTSNTKVNVTFTVH